MTPEPVDICCNKCYFLTSTSKNEWTRLGTSVIVPTEVTRYKTLQLAKGQVSVPLRTETEDIYREALCEGSCVQCGNVLGQRFIDTDCLDLVHEYVVYYEKAICLRSSDSHEYVVPVITDHNDKNMPQNAKFPVREQDGQGQSPLASGPVRPASQTSSQTIAESHDPRTILSSVAQQEVDIKKLSQSLKSLQDRMFALERRDLRASPKDSLRMEQDMFIDNFEAMLGALKETRSAGRTMEELRSENELLKRRLHAITAPNGSDADEDSSSIAAGTAVKLPSTAPSIPVKKKRQYVRRKPLGTQKPVMPAAPDMVDPDSRSATDRKSVV